MPLPFDRWPTILCGPILRRVTDNSVSVWLAFKTSQHVTLRVYQVDAQHYDGRGDTPGGRPTPLLSGGRDTAPLGKNLHVVCVTASVSTSGILMRDKMYCYDIELTPAGVAGSNEYDHNLAVNGLLQDSGVGNHKRLALGYQPGLLPRFSLPPNDLNHLRIFHGSCRKPHAPGTDALSVLDTLLYDAFQIPSLVDQAHKRPHQLFMTGDQIYADDVALALLHEFRQTANTLLGWTENIPGADRNNPSNAIPITDPILAPGWRQKVVWQSDDIKKAKFTSDHATCHLLGLGEFYAMYLFAWSNELWPDVLPTMQEVFVPYGSVEKWGPIVDAKGKLTDYGRVYHFDRLITADEVRELGETFIKEKPNLEEFLRTLPTVRRILANVPSYMICDDHEITDDWFLDENWTKANLDPTNRLSRRILTNGLAAFAVFQAWGNTPEACETGPGQELLTALGKWNGTNQEEINTIARCVGLDHMASVVGIGAPPISGRLVYDYMLKWAAHRVIVLDTRTHRSYSPDNAHAELLSFATLQRQVTERLIPDPTVQMTLVVSPAPVLGLRLMEELVQPLVEEWKDVFFADAEAWGMNQRAFQRFLRALAAEQRLVLLSGDVHYGMTVRGQFWDIKNKREAVFAQLTSSALKNEDPGTTYIPHKIGDGPFGTTAEFFVWENKNPPLYLGQPPMPDVNRAIKAYYESPAVVSGSEIECTTSTTSKADWCYRLEFQIDKRPRNLVISPTLPTRPSWNDREAAVSMYQVISKFVQEVLNTRVFGRQCVGLNNLGEVTFDSSSWGVKHYLWWQLPGRTPGSLTQHVINLNLTGPQPTTWPCP